MTDTLRSIVDGMEHNHNYFDECAHVWVCFPRCAACRLLALFVEAEQVDLVKKWNAECEERKRVKYHIEADSYGRGFIDGKESCADEFTTWLAVNKERIDADTLLFDSEARVNRIKAEARLEEHDDCCVVCAPLGIPTFPENRKDQCDRRAELEAQAQAKRP